MSILQALVIATTLIFIVGVVLLLSRFGADRDTPSVTPPPPPMMPSQRSPLTQAQIVQLNQAYGAGQIGENEYQRRRKELLTRDG